MKWDLKAHFQAQCTYVADALFLISIFQENVAEITGVNLFTWNRKVFK